MRKLLCRLGLHRVTEVRLLLDDFNEARDIVFKVCKHCGVEW